jgi:hypothetical protein
MLGFRSQERFVFGAFAISILFLCYVADRGQFAHLILGYSLAFYAYYHWIEKRRFRKVKSILTQAIIIRLLILFALPLLSDDYYRFIWDGLIQCQGINPFAYLPSEISDPSPYMNGLLENMNSPDYYSIYPPVLQWLWYGVSALVGENTMAQVMLMRAVIILADIGVIVVGTRILRAMKMWEGNVALYALNPIVIVELTGNLHFEGLMIFFSLLAIYLFIRMKESADLLLLPAGALALAIGVMSKLVFVLSLPAMWRKWGWWRTLLAGAITLGMTAWLSSYFFDKELIQNVGQSFDLYFRNFEFNASVFNLIEFIASNYIPHYTVQVIGPWVTGAMVLVICLIAVFRKADTYPRFFETLLFILSVHLLFASTVHPWYVVNLLAIAMFTRYRYPVVWSFAAVFSYFMYSNGSIEVWWIIAIEYTIVISYAVWEIWKGNRLNV